MAKLSQPEVLDHFRATRDVNYLRVTRHLAEERGDMLQNTNPAHLRPNVAVSGPSGDEPTAAPKKAPAKKK